MRHLVLVAAGLLAATVLAGCLSAGPPPAQEAGPDMPPPDGETGGSGNTSQEPLPPPPTPAELVVWLTPERALAYEAPAEGRVPFTYNLFDPRTATGAQDNAPWMGPAVGPGSLRVVGGTVDLWFSSDTPQPETASLLGFDPVAVWLGQGAMAGLTQQIPGPAQLAPGEVAHVQAELELPRGGYVFEAGATPSLILVFAYGQGEATPIQVHVGGEQASRLTLRVVPYVPAEHASVAEEQHAGEFAFHHFLVENPDPAQQVHSFPVTLTATTQKLEAVLDGQGPANQDLDLVLADAAGDVVWASTSPGTDESLVLYDVNFQQAGEYTLRVQNFQSVDGTYALTVRVHQSAPP